METKVAIVTGANSGIGKATAEAFVNMGIHVVMVCRNKERGQAAVDDILAKTGGQATLMQCDLGDMSSIRKFCSEFISRFDRLDILVNNAGILSTKRQETKDGLEMHFGVNHMGPFLLTTSLLPLLTSTPYSRIVMVSSMAYRIGSLNFKDLQMKKKYTPLSAYGRSKLCNILFTKELARRLEPTTTTINCLHPGVVATHIGASRGSTNYKVRDNSLFMKVFTRFCLTPEQGAATSIYLATSPECKWISGEYFVRCKLKKTNKKSHDTELAQKLWRVSEQMISSK